MKVNYISALPLCREKLNKLMPRFILPLSSQRENNCRVNKHCLDWWLMEQFGSLIFTSRWWIHTDEAAGGQKRVLAESPGSPPALPQPNRWLSELQASSTLMRDYCVWRSEDLLVDSVILETNMDFCLCFTDSQLRTVITHMQMRRRSFSMDASAACAQVWLVLESNWLV